MALLRVARAARRDLADIAAFTRDRWGEAQAEKYLRQLDARFKLLARSPELGRRCDHVRPGLLKYAEGRHVIYYRDTGATVDIVRVLHDAMDPDRHF